MIKLAEDRFLWYQRFHHVAIDYLRDARPQFFGGVLQVWEKLYAAATLSGVDRAGLGLDECGFAFSGGGALAPSVQEFFHGLGVPLAEGWGQSELVSAATCAPPGRIRAGTVGLALPGVTVRAAPDGELLVRSGSRMVGYTDPSLPHTAEDGWVHTGDLGDIDKDGYVRILGRREEVFRLAGVWEPGRAEELIHTGKLRRGLIMSKHADVVQAMS